LTTRRPLCVELYALFDRCIEELGPETHRLGAEEAIVHLHERADRGLEVHVGEDVALELDAGGDLDELQSAGCDGEHAALGDVEHRLAGLDRKLARIGDLLDRLDELAHAPLAHDAQPAVIDGDLEAAGGEGSGEHEARGVLADVDEAAGAGEAGPEPRDVDVALSASVSAMPRQAMSRPPPS
jgi:hypothetical protein